MPEVYHATQRIPRGSRLIQGEFPAHIPILDKELYITGALPIEKTALTNTRAYYTYYENHRIATVLGVYAIPVSVKRIKYCPADEFAFRVADLDGIKDLHAIALQHTENLRTNARTFHVALFGVDTAGLPDVFKPSEDNEIYKAAQTHLDAVMAKMLGKLFGII